VSFVLFLLVNAALFIRPGELFPEWEEVPIYQILIICCALAAIPAVSDQLRPSALRLQPITVGVLGMLVAIELSCLWQFKTWEARTYGYEFAKVVCYYLLLVGLLTTAERYRVFLLCLLGGITFLTTLALLQYYDVIDLQALTVLQQREVDEVTGEVSFLPRLRSTGIFNDPNDLCLILIVGIGIAGCRWEESKSALSGLLWLVPVTVFVYALALTQSRGGLLGLLAGLMVFTWQKFGLKKAICAGMMLLPVMLFIFGGRQTKLDTGETTAQQRILLWSDGLLLLREAPVFGIGMNKYAEELGLVAHNSFVHCYTELGLFGGTIFFGLYYITLSNFRRLGNNAQAASDELARLRPYLMAIVTGQLVGMLSLSRCYAVSTYIALGLSAAYFNLVAVPNQPSPLPAVDRQLCARLGLASVLFLAGTHLFVRTFAQYG
jgi:putative inorganic carbon (hco3(-)) transporter